MAIRNPGNPSYRNVVAALAETEERYRVLVEGVRRYAIFMLDPKGTIMTWNRGIEELLGYGREEVIGQSGAVVFTTENGAALFKKELRTAEDSGESLAEHTMLTKAGTEVRVHDTLTALRDSDGGLIGFAKVTRRVDDPHARESDASAMELAKALAALQLEVQHRRRLEALLLSAVENERERLGRDLHDDLSQRLAAVGMITASFGKRAKNINAQEREQLATISQMLADIAGVARNLSRGLHPIALTSEGLPAALAELAARVPKAVRFSWPTSKRLDLEQSVALHVYRLAEEAVGNAIRHSEAREISIELKTLRGRKVCLAIIDDGKGFLLEARPEGMGLQNMKYRAGVIGGNLTVSSAPGGGTIVKCVFPLRSEEPCEAARRDGQVAQ